VYIFFDLGSYSQITSDNKELSSALFFRFAGPIQRSSMPLPNNVEKMLEAVLVSSGAKTGVAWRQHTE
jgi:hypothetical protein